MISRPICTKCNLNLVKKNGISKKSNTPLYKKYCSPCEGKIYNIKDNTYRGYKKDKCEKCGFIPIHPCQLDVDHIDGNHSNNNEENLQTLCANCHRLKTQIARNLKIKKASLI